MLAEAAMLAVLSVEHGPGAESCLGQTQLARSVERRLKRRVFVLEAEAQLRLRVRFVQRASEIEARIELSNKDGTPRGTRSLVTTGHCSKLDDSLALSVALLVDQPPEPEPPATPEGAAVPAPTAATSQAAPTRVIVIPPEVAAPREPWHFAVGAGAKAAWGVLPGIRPAALFALRLVPRSFPAILLKGEAFWPASAERDEDSGARFRLLRLGLAICPAIFAGQRATLGACVGQQLGWLSAEGYGFDHDAKQQRLGYALTLGGEGGLRLFSPVSLRGYVGAEVPLVRDRFTSGGRDAQQLFRPSPLGVVAEIGLEALLW